MVNLTSHSATKYATGTCLANSKNRDWQPILAEIWQHDAGRLADTKPVDTEIVVMLSGKARVQRKGDGKFQESIGVPGTVWLCPSGIQESDIKLEGQIDRCLHLYIPAAPFSDTILMEFDIDPARATLRYEGGFHDRFIEQIGKSLAQILEDEQPASKLLLETHQAALSAHVIANYSNLDSQALAPRQTAGRLDPRRLDRVLRVYRGEFGAERHLARYRGGRMP